MNKRSRRKFPTVKTRLFPMGAGLAAMILLLSPVAARAENDSGEAISQVTGGQDVVIAAFSTRPPSSRVSYVLSIHGSVNPLNKAAAVARCVRSGCSVTERDLTEFEHHEDGSLSIALWDDDRPISLELTPVDDPLGAGSQQWGYYRLSPSYFLDENKVYVFGQYFWSNFAESQYMQPTGNVGGDSIDAFAAVYAKGTVGHTTIGWNGTG